MQGDNAREMIDFINDSGMGVIGTPEMARAQVERLWAQSAGGFGCYMMLAHNWANFDATKRSYDLIARHVFPHFQCQHHATADSAARAAAARPALAETHSKAVDAARERYAAETAVRH